MIVGSAVILFDPIFQGLAMPLMAGEVASLFLSRMTVPILFYVSERKNHEVVHEQQVPLATECSLVDIASPEEGSDNHEAVSVFQPNDPDTSTIPTPEEAQGSEASYSK